MSEIEPLCKHCHQPRGKHSTGGFCPPLDTFTPILTRAEEAKAEPAGRPARSEAVKPLPPGERKIEVSATHYQDAERALEARIAQVREEMERLRTERHEARQVAERAVSALEAIAATVGASPEEPTVAAVQRYIDKQREALIAVTGAKTRPGSHLCTWTGTKPGGYCPTCGAHV